MALAWLEQEGKRALTLNGKSLAVAVAEAAEPGDDGRTLVLELPLEALQEQRPRLKARWVGGGSTADFHAELDALAIRGWHVAIARYEPVCFSAWP